jgi:hypothetical protein
MSMAGRHKRELQFHGESFRRIVYMKHRPFAVESLQPRARVAQTDPLIRGISIPAWAIIGNPHP